MGVDWFRFRVKPGADPARLRALVREQAFAFQVWYGWEQSLSDEYPLMRDLLVNAHTTPGLDASRQLLGLIELPEYDREKGHAKDIPDLAPCWRVYPITDNDTFPPSVRFAAGRTYLPGEVAPALDGWRGWNEAVRLGRQDEYLAELHWYETARQSRYFWDRLHAAAVGSFEDDGKREPRPGFLATRERILRLRPPRLPRVRCLPTDRSAFDPGDLEKGYAEALTEAQAIIELTTSWNRGAPKRWRTQGTLDFFRLTLDEFRALASDSWLDEFFEWAERCADLGFGLYLDH